MIQVQEGKRYEFLQKTRSGSGRFTAVVTSIEARNGFNYVGFRPDNQRYGKWGFFRVRTDGSSYPYGIIPIRECD